jgi:acyl-CoA synthetase (AMP-forming)/AMP-acid ligase II
VPCDPDDIGSAPDPVFGKVIADVAGHFTEPGRLTLISMPSAETLFPTLGAFKPSAQFEALPPLDRTTDYSTASIVHSSGSTAWPKANYLTERSAMIWQCAARHAEYTYGPDVRLGAMALPLFHGMGVYVSTTLPFATGCRALLFRPASRSEGTGIEAVTADTVLMAASQVPCNALVMAPSMLTVRCLWYLPIAVDVHNP